MLGPLNIHKRLVGGGGSFACLAPPKLLQACHASRMLTPSMHPQVAAAAVERCLCSRGRGVIRCFSIRFSLGGLVFLCCQPRSPSFLHLTSTPALSQGVRLRRLQGEVLCREGHGGHEPGRDRRPHCQRELRQGKGAPPSLQRQAVLSKVLFACWASRRPREIMSSNEFL